MGKGRTVKRLRVVKNKNVKIREPRDGKDGRDAPELETILRSIPTPKNGERGPRGEAGKDSPSMDDIIDNIKPFINHGRNGKDAPTMEQILSEVTPLIPRAENGQDGRDGVDGETPDHEIDKKNFRIRFRKPSGVWGVWIEFKKFLENLPRQIIQQPIIERGGGGGLSEELGIWKKCIEKHVYVPADSQMVRAGDLCVINDGKLILDGDAYAL